MATYEVEDWETGYRSAKTQADRDKALKEYSDAKLRNAARREEERLNSPTMIDKFMNGIKALKKKMMKKRENAKIKSMQDQKTR